MPFDPDELIGSFESRAAEQAQRALRLSAELESASVTMRSDGGEVTVRVDSAGGLADLRFHPQSERLSRDDLARLVLATSRRAQSRLAEQVGVIVTNMYGASSGTTALVADAYAKRFPTVDNGEGVN